MYTRTVRFENFGQKQHGALELSRLAQKAGVGYYTRVFEGGYELDVWAENQGSVDAFCDFLEEAGVNPSISAIEKARASYSDRLTAFYNTLNYQREHYLEWLNWSRVPELISSEVVRLSTLPETQGAFGFSVEGFHGVFDLRTAVRFAAEKWAQSKTFSKPCVVPVREACHPFGLGSKKVKGVLIQLAYPS